MTSEEPDSPGGAVVLTWIYLAAGTAVWRAASLFGCPADVPIWLAAP
jgi:hypothetical protein